MSGGLFFHWPFSPPISWGTFFYINGNYYGPRYLFEVASILMIPASYGFFAVAKSLPERFRPFLYALPLTSLLFMLTIILPPMISYYSDAAWSVDDRTKKVIEESGIRGSVLLLSRGNGSYLNLQENPPFDRYGNLILKDRTTENEYLATYFDVVHGKKSFMIDYVPGSKKEPVVRRIFPSDQNRIVIEMEFKQKPITGLPAYATRINIYRNDYYFPVGIVDEDIELSNDNAYGILFKELGEKSYYDFSHPVINEGRYDISIKMLKERCGSLFDFYVNGEKIFQIDTFGENEEEDEVFLNAFLKRGINKFMIKPINPDSCIVVDKVEMKRN